MNDRLKYSVAITSLILLAVVAVTFIFIQNTSPSPEVDKEETLLTESINPLDGSKVPEPTGCAANLSPLEIDLQKFIAPEEAKDYNDLAAMVAAMSNAGISDVEIRKAVIRGLQSLQAEQRSPIVSWIEANPSQRLPIDLEIELGNLSNAFKDMKRSLLGGRSVGWTDEDWKRHRFLFGPIQPEQLDAIEDIGREYRLRWLMAEEEGQPPEFLDRLALQRMEDLRDLLEPNEFIHLELLQTDYGAEFRFRFADIKLEDHEQRDLLDIQASLYKHRRNISPLSIEERFELMDQQRHILGNERFNILLQKTAGYTVFKSDLGKLGKTGDLALTIDLWQTISVSSARHADLHRNTDMPAQEIINQMDELFIELEDSINSKLGPGGWEWFLSTRNGAWARMDPRRNVPSR